MASIDSRPRRNWKIDKVTLRAFGKIVFILLVTVLTSLSSQVSTAQVSDDPLFQETLPPRLPIAPSPLPTVAPSPGSEYLWYETEDMRGFATQPNGEPVLNPSWLNLPRAKAPGWDMNGTGTSAEWTPGGESG